MRQNIKIPRILKIEDIKGFTLQCMFNNGESRLLDFEKIFKQWQVSEEDLEYKILNINEFKKVKLRNYTLSWHNIQLKIENEIGESEFHPYEIDPKVLYDLSNPVDKNNLNQFGNIIKTARLKAGLTQEQLALRSGTTRFYISRVENNKTDLEISTFRKIVEAGLGKNLKVIID